MSLRDKISAAKDIESEMVEIPVWGVTVEVRSMRASERSAVLQQFADNDGKVDLGKAMADVIIHTAFDPETGELAFQESDREMLDQKSGAAIQRLAEVGMRLSGMMADAIDASGKDSSSTENVDSFLS